MKKAISLFCCLGAALFASTFTSCSDNDDNNGSVSKPDLEFYGLTANNSLLKYNAKNTATAISATMISGLQASETILAIDFRPATGQLYGLGSSSRLYTINLSTGAATAVGAAPFALPLTTGSLAGFDFNPNVDRIRLVTSTGINLRLNPETSAIAATDTNLNPGTPSVSSAAYTNNYAGAASTELFVIDSATGTLFKQDPPNNGTLTSIGSLDVTGTISGNGGFDIAPDGTALASLTTDGANHLFQINTATGESTDLGMLATAIVGLAIPTAPVAFAADASNNLHIFNFNNPGTPTVKAIAGLQASETIYGIDFRPATGQLYALGSTGRIYTLNTATGAATAVGAGPAQALTGTDYGFDFNPTVDRIRVVGNTGQNFRINPNDGTLSGSDGALNPGTPSVSAAAYTNSYAGATTTALFDIDSSTDMLYAQNPPNNGTLVAIGSLGFDVAATNGFDIGGTSNMGYAILSVGGTNGIYTINTTTGAATLVTAFPTATIRGFAVGLGF